VAIGKKHELFSWTRRMTVMTTIKSKSVTNLDSKWHHLIVSVEAGAHIKGNSGENVLFRQLERNDSYNK
jgi:hypothetical protein